MNLVIGKMSITAKGFGFVIPDNGLEEGKAKVDDIFHSCWYVKFSDE